MKRFSFGALVLIFTAFAVKADPWTLGTAHTMAPQTYELGVFSPLRYGLNETTEISTHPVFFFLLPNATVKKQWFKKASNAIATEHTLSYPSFFLKKISRRGTGGILPSNTKVPSLLTLNNQFYFTHSLRSNLWLTPQISIEHTFNAKMDEIPTIDFPLAYQRTASYHTGTIFRVGLDMDGELSAKWSFSVDVDYYHLPDMDGDSAWEHKAIVRYALRKTFLVLAGYKYIDAVYPFGGDSRFFPLLDFVWQID